MNQLTKRVAITAATVAFATVTAYAADSTGRSASTQTKILLMDDQSTTGSVRAVNQTQPFFDGQRFRLNVKSSQDGYLYVVCLTNQGEGKLLYPTKGDDDNMVLDGTSRTIPERAWYRFDEDPGTERVFVMLSPEPISELDRAVGEGSVDKAVINKYASGSPAIRKNPPSKGIELDGPAPVSVQRIALRHESR